MKPISTLFLLATLTACGSSYPSVEAPGLARKHISLLFKFPEGSVCRITTSAGQLETTTIPSSIKFQLADRNAPASCTLPDGNLVRVTAHNFVPDNNAPAAITVYPNGDAFITTATKDGKLIQLRPTGTVN